MKRQLQFHWISCKAHTDTHHVFVLNVRICLLYLNIATFELYAEQALNGRILTLVDVHNLRMFGIITDIYFFETPSNAKILCTTYSWGECQKHLLRFVFVGPVFSVSTAVNHHIHRFMLVVNGNFAPFDPNLVCHLFGGTCIISI